VSFLRDFEILRSEVDSHGYDLVIEASRNICHIQLKALRNGGKRSDVALSTRLAAKPSGSFACANRWRACPHICGRKLSSSSATVRVGNHYGIFLRSAESAEAILPFLPPLRASSVVLLAERERVMEFRGG
jgi:hypothetical protein